MRIPSGSTDRYIYFVAVDATDFTTRETGLATWTVYRSRNGAAAAAMTTPTINETDTTNMPGVYELLLDEDTTLTAGNDTEELTLHITHAGMAPVTRVVELYRPETTEGNTLDVTSTGAGGIDWANVENQATSVDLSATAINLCDTVTTLTGHTAQTGDTYALANGGTGFAVIDTVVDAIKVKTDFLPSATAGAAGGVFIAGTNAATTITTGLTTTFTGNLTGSVGSVTGAVGSVTGSVGSVVGHTAQTGDTYALANGATGFAAIDTVVDTINANVGTPSDLGGGATISANMGDVAGATFATSTDSLEAIRDRGDAAWTTGAGGSDRLLMVDTTIATLATQVSFTLTAGSTDDDAYNGCTIVIEDAATATQKAIGVVDDYTGSTKTVTLLEDPAVFTMAATDKVYILAEKGIKPTTAADYHLDISATGTAGIDWGNVDNPTTAVDLSATDIQLCDTVTTLTGHTAQTADHTAAIADIPTVAEFNARTLVAASYFDPAADTVANVTTVATTTNLTNLPTIPANWITAAGINASALDGKGDWNTTTPPTAAAIADQVWDETQATHVTAGSFGEIATEIAAITGFSTHSAADVWTAATRVLTAATNITSDGAAINTTAGVVDTVNLVNTTTTNTDMRGTDSAATATALAAAQTDLDTITDTGVTCVALTSAAITDVWSTDTLPEAYAADGAAGTPAQIVYLIQQHLSESSITGTTKTVKKLDGSTTAGTFTLNDATTPTSITRAT